MTPAEFVRAATVRRPRLGQVYRLGTGEPWIVFYDPPQAGRQRAFEPMADDTGGWPFWGAPDARCPDRPRLWRAAPIRPVDPGNYRWDEWAPTDGVWDEDTMTAREFRAAAAEGAAVYARGVGYGVAVWPHGGRPALSLRAARAADGTIVAARRAPVTPSACEWADRDRGRRYREEVYVRHLVAPGLGGRAACGLTLDGLEPGYTATRAEDVHCPACRRAFMAPGAGVGRGVSDGA